MDITKINNINSLDQNLSIPPKDILKDQKESKTEINNLDSNRFYKKIEDNKVNLLGINNNIKEIPQKSQSITTINNDNNDIIFPPIQQKQNNFPKIQINNSKMKNKNNLDQLSLEKLKILKNLNGKEKSLCSKLSQIKSKNKQQYNI